MTYFPDTDNSKMQKTHEGEHHGDFGDIPIKLTRSTYIYALCASLNSCNLGYDIGVSTGAGRLIQEDLGLTTREREIFSASLNFWAIFGALASHYFTDTYGRRPTFIVSAVVFITGIIWIVLSNTYTMLMVGRMFVGLGVGVGLAIDPMYIAEVTPARYRGELVTWSEIGINVGLVFGFSTNLFLSGIDDSSEWRVMFLLGAALPCLMIILVLSVMPETPRWLVMKDRMDQARERLRDIYPPGFDVEPVLEDMKQSIAIDEAAGKTVGWSFFVHPTPAYARMIMVGVSIAIAQQAVGIEAIQYYLLDIIHESGVESDEKQSLVLVLLGVVKLLFIFVAGKCFDRKGRRFMLFLSLIGMACALLVVGIAFMIDSSVSTGAQVTGLALYLAFFSVGIGPACWLISSEVFSLSIRSKAMSVAATMNRVVATIMSATFLSTANAMGFGAFFCMLAVICVIVLAFFYKFLPETKGRSLEDMTLYFTEVTGDNSLLEVEALLTQSHPPKQTSVPSSFEIN